MSERSSVLELIDEVYAKEPQLRRLLLKHSFDVWQTALKVIENHRELGIDEQLLFEGTMAHDIGIRYCDAPDIMCFGSEPYLLHGVRGGRLLRSRNLVHLAPFAERHTGVGLQAQDFLQQGLAIPDVVTEPQTIEEELLTYADKFHSKSHPNRTKTVAEVEKSLSKFGEDRVARFRLWDKRFGV